MGSEMCVFATTHYLVFRLEQAHYVILIFIVVVVVVICICNIQATVF
jgi:hypothetical protein